MDMYKLENYSELSSTQGIYFITNIINNKYYLGRAVNIKDRYSWKDIEYSHHNYLLRNSILKYGRENFIVSVVEYPNITLEELINIEQGLLDIHYGNGLCVNLSPFANGGTEAGENHPTHGKKWYNNGIKNKLFSLDEEIPEGFVLGVKEETRKKHSEAKKGENNPCYGKRWYNNGIKEICLSLEEKIPEGFIKGGLPASDEEKRKNSIANTGKSRSIESRKKQSKAQIGKKHSEETKKKLSEIKKGEKNPNYGKRWYNNGIKSLYLSPEEKIPEGYFIGRLQFSEKTRKKQSMAKQGKKLSEEHKQKISNKGKNINCGNKVRVIGNICCYFSIVDACIELNIPKSKFLKLFQKDCNTGFYIEK